MNHTTKRLKGIIMIIIGSMLWGATGPMMEWVLSSSHMSVSFMLTIRLLLAGFLILCFLVVTKRDIYAIWKQPYWWIKLVIFSVFGMLGVQYTFVAAIHASNAVLATLLQFLAPIFVVLYVSFSQKMFPPRYQIFGILGTLIGLFLLLTNGSISNLLVSPVALLWGLGVGLTFAFYTLYPTSVMNEWGVLVVIGWSMLIGGLLLGFSKGFWEFKQYALLAESDTNLMLLAIIFFGTIAFILFLSSMKYISPVETSILSSFEPLTAMFISVIWLGSVLAGVQIIGIILMILCVVWLSIEGNRQSVKMKEE
ncbi:MAG: DMT family transporter [Kurthia gibsonii]|uniref:EamA family transporter n=1 Tax=Kurthia gibsonii TaxID=33946 RepID=A0ABU9LL71_9BACL|nr:MULTISPECIES: EamA family transporter [Kurthia]MCA9725582.1 EamA family transporter [Kurthia sp.]AMA64234.1 UAA transporter family protein [Kurthia sp. 11kri321]MEB7772151.1 DMT family transporter [Kurthia gibsonii]RXH52611.1 EamA family transporter [Kurthia gibsonii]HZG11505.1 EamA family transporter [Kurthia gibsonii]